MYRLRTVDVWDTLIRRNCHPEAIKLALAHHIRLGFPGILRPDYRDHWAIYSRRLVIERQFAAMAEASGHDGEYRIEDVLGRLIDDVTEGMDADAVRSTARTLSDHELQLEMENTAPDTGVAAILAQYPAERTLYLSDFYMGSERLERLIAHHGLLEKLDGGLVSCDLMLNKRSGRLFRHVHAQFGLLPEMHVHIGDNPHADVAMPRSLGITAVSYLPEEPHRERIAREQLFASRDQLFDHLRGRIADEGGEGEVAFRLGLQAAPLFIAYGLYIAERSLDDRLDRLFFFTREGEFFHRVHMALFPDGRHAGHELPPVSTLGVSRQATFRAGLRIGDLLDYRRIWALDPRKRLSNILQILGLDPKAMAEPLNRHGLHMEQMVEAPDRDGALRGFLLDADVQKALVETVKRARTLLQQYLGEQGVRDGERIGCVDIGWRGTIQDNLARILQNNSLHGYYLALRAFLNPQPENAVKRSFGPDEREMFDADIFAAFEPMEMLCNSANGSVGGYRLDGDRVEPVREIDARENTAFAQFAQPFQDGVVRAAEIAAPLLRMHAVSSDELKPLAMHLWRELVRRPPEEMVRAYATAPQHDVFGTGGMFERARAPGLRAMVMSVVDERRRQDVVQYIRRTQWTPGIEGLGLGPVDRMALRSAYWLAHKFKRLQVEYRKRIQG